MIAAKTDTGWYWGQGLHLDFFKKNKNKTMMFFGGELTKTASQYTHS